MRARANGSKGEEEGRAAPVEKRRKKGREEVRGEVLELWQRWRGKSGRKSSSTRQRVGAVTVASAVAGAERVPQAGTAATEATAAGAEADQQSRNRAKTGRLHSHLNFSGLVALTF